MIRFLKLILACVRCNLHCGFRTLTMPFTEQCHQMACITVNGWTYWYGCSCTKTFFFDSDVAEGIPSETWEKVRLFMEEENQ